jgi:hypothetical protein
LLVSCGISTTGASLIFISFTPCPGFLQGPGDAPDAILINSTTKCRDWTDHPGYAKYMAKYSLSPTYFAIVGNVEDANTIDLVNCQAITEQGIVTAGGGAQWGGAKAISCYSRPIAIESSSWGQIKLLFR